MQSFVCIHVIHLNRKKFNTHIYFHLRTKIYKYNVKESLLKHSMITEVLNCNCFTFKLSTFENFFQNFLTKIKVLWTNSIILLYFLMYLGWFIPKYQINSKYYLAKMFHHYFAKWSFSVQEWNPNANYFSYQNCSLGSLQRASIQQTKINVHM